MNRTISYSNVVLRKAEIVSSKLCEGTLVLSLTFIVEDEDRVYEVTIPELDTGIRKDRLIIDELVDLARQEMLPLLYRQFPELISKNGQRFNLIGSPPVLKKVLKEKEHVMTVAEIEEKLGYKIKIISDKEEN